MESYNISLFIIFLCIVCSAYFSATETAFTSLNRIRIKNLAEKDNSRAELVLHLLDHYDNLLSTILIGNNLVNIAATSLATVICVDLFGSDKGSAISTLITTLVLLVFCEISPKSLAKESPERFSMFSAPIINALIILFTPLNLFFAQWKKFLASRFTQKEDHAITEEELLTMIDEAETEGGLDNSESVLIKNSIEFGDLEAEDILTPRVDVTGVDLTDSWEEINDIFQETGFSRLPVYEDNMDHIIGVLHQKDFYANRDKTVDIKELIRPVIYVSPHKEVDSLLRQLQTKKTHIAVVVDEYGGTIGIVTMEDILEELVGEIWDEHDEVIQEIEKVSDSEYIILGNMMLDKLFDFLGIDDESDPLTVSGWILDLAKAIPQEGEHYSYKNLRLTVLEMDRNKVERIRLQILPKDTETED